MRNISSNSITVYVCLCIKGIIVLKYFFIKHLDIEIMERTNMNIPVWSVYYM